MAKSITRSMTISDSAVAPSAEPGDYVAYRALSKSAVLSLLFGFLAVAGLLAIPLMVLGLCGVLFAGLALRSLRCFPNELTGLRTAQIGLGLNLVMLISAAGLHTWVYLTEVPEGYQRISFYDLRPPRRSMKLVSPAASSLNGKKVFIKGYMHPGVKAQGSIRQFVLVPDMKTCCFGGQPDLFDMMEVTLTTTSSLKYRMSVLKLAGEFLVNEDVVKSNQQKKVAGQLLGGLFELRVDQVR